jgi:hypothetical protein
MNCVECKAETYGKFKDFCTRCDWSCDHEFVEVTTNDEVNGVVYFEKCVKCKKEINE